MVAEKNCSYAIKIVLFTSVEDTKSMGDIWPLNLRDGGKIEPDILFTEPFRYSSEMVTWVSKHAESDSEVI